jgi:hypothetical protein
MAVNRGLSSGTTPWVITCQAIALVLLFLGERVFSSIGWLREALTGIGAIALLTVTGLRWIAARATDGERRSIERALAILSTTIVAAVLVYLTTAEPFDARLGIAKLATATRNRYEAAATVVWVALLLVSLVPLLFAERALSPMRGAARVEWRRVRSAMTAGFAVGLAAVYGALFCFAAGELEVKADFSYFHTARPSESTRKIAESADKLRVLSFFPTPNEVGNEVSTYLLDLDKGLPNVDVEPHDRLLDPQLAQDAKVTSDGVVVLEHGSQRETISLGTDIQAARPKLKTLDADFQKALLKVVREKRTAYFTVGHGELNDAQPSPQNEGRTGKGARAVLERQNYVVKDLGASSGLGVDVPDDATMVIVLGPQHAFLPEEVGSLKRYAERGGKVFLALEPDPKGDFAPLADIFGLTVSPSTLANDKVHMRVRFNDSDRVVLATNRFSSHAAVSTLSRVGSRAVYLLGAAALDKKAGADASLKVDFALRALPDTFDDANGNFKFDPPAEKRTPFPLAAAVSRSVAPPPGSAKKPDEMRAFVLGDADAMSDAAVGPEGTGADGNVLLLTDAVRWLGGEESFAGTISTAEDVRIEHTKQKDMVWFYGTIFAAPALVLGGGLFYTRRLARKGPRKSRSAPAGSSGGGPAPGADRDEKAGAS